MQAMRRDSVLGPGTDSGQFAALRHVTREMSSNSPAMPGMRRSSSAPLGVAGAGSAFGVAEGAGLAHDAGNLLGALSLYSDLLAMPGVLHEEHREYAAELRMLSDRSWAMIDRLVNHARAGRTPEVTSETSVLPDVVDRCKGLLSKIAGRTVEISYGVGAFQPVGVPVESVERILTNLVKNAAEATPWVGAISIGVEGVTEHAEDGVEEARRRVVMTVRDRGCGMDAAAVRRLMQAGGSSKSGGRGLGFRVVRELVAMSGGCLKIESQPEVGTSISVEWYGMTEADAAMRQEYLSGSKAGVRRVLKGEAGWIAC
jgi:C4-dicarboxylate-specific signal transduction histidine kinase